MMMMPTIHLARELMNYYIYSPELIDSHQFISFYPEETKTKASKHM